MNLIKSKNIECVVFDLDGTLFSSHESIYLATIRTFKELNINVKIPRKKFYLLIGHHFSDMFSVFDIEVKDMEHFINIYKNFYFDYIDYSKPYPGMYNLLNYLTEKKIKIGLLTTKGQEQAEKILNHFNIINQFDYIMGRRPGIAIKPHPQPLQLICDDLKVDTGNSIMVGDSELDIQCGKAAGSVTVGVTFGYRSKNMLKKEKPDFLIDELNQLKNIIGTF